MYSARESVLVTLLHDRCFVNSRADWVVQRNGGGANCHVDDDDCRFQYMDGSAEVYISTKIQHRFQVMSNSPFASDRFLPANKIL
jgi:hypothetical protein